MNPLTNVKNIQKLSEQELKRNFKTSWHDQYKDSAWVFIGGLPYDLTEGDVICVFSQYGEVVNLNLVRDKATGKSKGFCFLCYEDQRSTILAVDNFNGIKILGRVIRVDHVNDYKPPKESKNVDDLTKMLYESGCAPGSSVLSVSSSKNNEEECDSKDGIKKIKKEKKKKSKKEKRKRSEKKKSHKKKKKRKKEESSSSGSSESESSDSSSENDSDEEDSAVKEKESKKTDNHRELKDRGAVEDTVRVKVEEEEEENRRRRQEERMKNSRREYEERERTRKENRRSEASSDSVHSRRGFENESGSSNRRERGAADGGEEDWSEAGMSRRKDNWRSGTSSKEERKRENAENGEERRHSRDERGRGEEEWSRRRESAWVDQRGRKEGHGKDDGFNRKRENRDRFEGNYAGNRKDEPRRKHDNRSLSPQENDYRKSKNSH